MSNTLIPVLVGSLQLGHLAAESLGRFSGRTSSLAAPADPGGLRQLRIFDLEQPRHEGAPIHPSHQTPGYAYLLHRRHQPHGGERRTGASGVLITSEHVGTHIDALSHQAEDLKLHGGVPTHEVESSFGFLQLGAETVPPIVARGLLIDLVRHRGSPAEPGRWIDLEEVQTAASDQGVQPEAGDVVLIRTGNGRYWSEPGRYLEGAGMAAGVSSWLAKARVVAVGADNVAWDWTGEPDPDLGVTLPGHVLLLVRAGVYIVENLFLEELGAAAVSEFTFVCLPLKIAGATGSPVRPVALIAT
jgi:kynurenine formamidase